MSFVDHEFTAVSSASSWVMGGHLGTKSSFYHGQWTRLVPLLPCGHVLNPYISLYFWHISSSLLLWYLRYYIDLTLQLLFYMDFFFVSTSTSSSIPACFSCSSCRPFRAWARPLHLFWSSGFSSLDHLHQGTGFQIHD